MKQQLHSGARWKFRFNTYLVLIFLSGFAWWFTRYPAWLVISIYFKDTRGLTFIILPILIDLLIILMIGEIYARLSYNNWSYEFTNKELKLERGVIWKKYSNIPYEKIQNIDIHRGVLARMLGFSAFSMQTAGYSGQNPYGEGYIPAIEMKHAEKIREFIMKKIKQIRRGKHGF